MTKSSKSALTSGIALLGFILQVIPSAYITITGNVPMWIRIWMGAWLALWLLTTVANSARNSN